MPFTPDDDIIQISKIIEEFDENIEFTTNAMKDCLYKVIRYEWAKKNLEERTDTREISICALGPNIQLNYISDEELDDNSNIEFDWSLTLDIATLEDE